MNADLHAVAVNIDCPASPEEKLLQNNFEDRIARVIFSHHTANPRHELRQCTYSTSPECFREIPPDRRQIVSTEHRFRVGIRNYRYNRQAAIVGFHLVNIHSSKK